MTLIQHIHVLSVFIYVGVLPNEKSRLQIVNPKVFKVNTIDVSNIISVQPIMENRIITILLPNNTELKFRADSEQLLMAWVCALKVAIGKGKVFMSGMHVRVCVCMLYVNHKINFIVKLTGIKNESLVCMHT